MYVFLLLAHFACSSSADKTATSTPQVTDNDSATPDSPDVETEQPIEEPEEPEEPEPEPSFNPGSIASPTGCHTLLQLVEPQAPFGEFTLGDFRLQLGENQEIQSYSIKNPQQSIFQGQSSSWLQAGLSDLLVEEHQGSFDIQHETTSWCSELLLEEVQYADNALMIHGGFGDLTPACASLTFQLQICQLEEDRLAFSLDFNDPSRINHISLQLISDMDERIYGMGEQFPHETLNLKGQLIPVIVQEGGVGRGHPVISPVVNRFSKGSQGSETSTYYVAPHFLTSHLRSTFLKGTSYAEFDFRKEDSITIHIFDSHTSWENLYGDNPLGLISSFTEYSGRMPVPPQWINNGVVLALTAPLDESLQIVDKLQASGVSIAAVWNQTWSGINETFIGEQVLWNWQQNQYTHPGWNNWVQELHNRDVRVMCYINSMFLDVSNHETPVDRNLYQEGIENSYFVLDHEDNTLHLPVTAFEVSLLDLTNPGARQWMKQIIQDELMDNASCSGWMADFAEALPFDAQLFDETPAELYHNQYAVEWAKLNREAIEEHEASDEILFFNRSGHTLSPTYSTMFWQGDQLTTWDRYDGIKSAVHGLLNGGFSGMTLNHSDIGGYTSLSRWGLGYTRGKQLLKRWAELGAFTSMMRTHEGNQPDSNAQVYDDDLVEHLARMSQIYKSLSFYRQELFMQASTKGWPVVRHLWLHYPDDPEAHQQDKQFLLGSSILVAPYLDKCLLFCGFEKEVYLPEGLWVHLWSGEAYEGRGFITVEAPLGYPAVFYQQDSPIADQLLTNLRTAGIDVHD